MIEIQENLKNLNIKKAWEKIVKERSKDWEFVNEWCEDDLPNEYFGISNSTFSKSLVKKVEGVK